MGDPADLPIIITTAALPAVLLIVLEKKKSEGWSLFLNGVSGIAAIIALSLAVSGKASSQEFSGRGL